MSKKQIKPKWFNGVVYLEGATVKNPFSGEEYELNALELSIYDFIIGANMTLERAYDRQEEPSKRLEKITCEVVCCK